MRKLFSVAVLTLAWAGMSCAASAGELVDRMVAAVNGKVILQSDWDQAVCYQALVDGRAPADVSAKERQASLDQLIDLELLRQQMPMADFQRATPQEAREQLVKIRGHEDEPKGISSCGMTEKELESHAALQLNVLRLVDSRLRASVHVDARSIEDYYRDQFLPELEKNGAQPVSLAQVTPKIKEVLTQQKINQALGNWLASLRSSSSIQSESLHAMENRTQ